MAENFERIPVDLSDPSRVRNFIKDIKNDVERKNYKLLFHIVYALACALVIYLASDTLVGTGLSLLLLCLAPSMCVFTFLYSPLLLRVLTVLLPLLVLVLRQGLSGGFEFFSMASSLFLYLLCILSAAVITKAVLSGYPKTVLFTCLGVVFGIVSFCQIMFSFISVYGSFSFALLFDTIGDFFDKLVEQSVALAQTPEGLEAFRSLATDGEKLTDEKIIKLVKESVRLSVSVVKPLIPSLFAFSCMLYGFVTVAIFSLFANHFRINVFVCIMDKKWTYRPSLVSAVAYDIVFFVFVISMFVSLPQSISATAMNLMFVLTPLMYISGVRGIYTFLYKKTKSEQKSRLITAVAVVLSTMILSGISFLLIGSMGVSFITARNRNEKASVPLVYAADLQMLKKLSEKEEQKDVETQPHNESRDLSEEENEDHDSTKEE